MNYLIDLKEVRQGLQSIKSHNSTRNRMTTTSSLSFQTRVSKPIFLGVHPEVMK